MRLHSFAPGHSPYLGLLVVWIVSNKAQVFVFQICPDADLNVATGPLALDGCDHGWCRRKFHLHRVTIV